MTKTYDVLLTTDHGNHRKSFSKFVFAKSFLDEIKFIYNAHLYKPLEFEDYNNLSYITLSYGVVLTKTGSKFA
ncbi:hypothetical protein [Rossellomorea marisflavi]|uniref:hypothetical protein n=1 Tax=Rossellomorea marisflavi TaxID=189381 RepID=UPI003FA190E8